ncbi:hydrogenase accessory protein HypB [Halothiobacillus diazotrophicus]|uniref:Hydrogenase maturation factor HypB n=1 Tax=Halothiobacillus diazotrophicus TaxID=1860122 RepID=A0A191ZES7_9GAMM|nr:hydrogenase nickel incorporation protein HypB [Halothiobacillus diazotrophicus]ANJ66367.1 hydrogenase accessory protein HypB [Halothiobacillus diazotrophicus]
MCETCGCAIPDHLHHAVDTQQLQTVEVLEGLKAHNDRAASHNRHHFDTAGVLVINLMSSPGAGKTSLLEATIDALKSNYRIAVIEGDLETENDAARIRAKGVPAVQISTGSACHLDADMVHRAVHELSLADIDILFIENVGNLVCPASFDLGQHLNIALLSTPEGDDKPLKYPVMFRACDLILVTKTDLLAVLDDFSCTAVSEHIRQLANPAPVFTLSSRRNDIAPWLDWLDTQHKKQRTPGFKPMADGARPRLAPHQNMANPLAASHT